MYDFMCWAWTLKHMIDEMFCVEWGALEHMSIWMSVLSKKLWITWVFKCLCWARSSEAHVCLSYVKGEAMKHMIVLLCWLRSSGTHELCKPLCCSGCFEAAEKIIGIVWHKPWSLPSLCWEKSPEHRILGHCKPRCILQIHPIIIVERGAMELH